MGLLCPNVRNVWRRIGESQKLSITQQELFEDTRPRDNSVEDCPVFMRFPTIGGLTERVDPLPKLRVSAELFYRIKFGSVNSHRRQSA